MGNTYSPSRMSGGPMGPNHRFYGLPINIISQIGTDGISGIQSFFNHFYRWSGPAGYSTTAVGGFFGDGSNNSEGFYAQSSNQFGTLRIITGSTEDNFAQLRMQGEPWRYVSGKRMWCFARFRLSNVDDMEAYFGLTISDSNFLDTLPTDGFFFEKAETATAFDFQVRQNGTSTEKTAVTGTLADSTFIELGFSVNSAGVIIPWYNGAAQTDDVVGADDANIPDDEDLTLVVGCQTGSAATAAMDLDWVLVAQER